jgi:hypothetical protein
MAQTLRLDEDEKKALSKLMVSRGINTQTKAVKMAIINADSLFKEVDSLKEQIRKLEQKNTDQKIAIINYLNSQKELAKIIKK